MDRKNQLVIRVAKSDKLTEINILKRASFKRSYMAASKIRTADKEENCHRALIITNPTILNELQWINDRGTDMISSFIVSFIFNTGIFTNIPTTLFNALNSGCSSSIFFMLFMLFAGRLVIFLRSYLLLCNCNINLHKK